MGKFKKIISAIMAGMTLFSMAPVNAESCNGEVETTQTSESVWEKAGSFIINLFLPQVFAAENDIASGISWSVIWTIDAEGTFTLKPSNGVSGQMASLSETSTGPPWYKYRAQIKKAVAEPGVALGYRANRFFYECSNLAEVDLNNLDTSNTVNMEEMFNGCRSLTSLEGLAEWDTGSVTNMSYMFSNCSKLTSLEGLARWETGNVKDMSVMFQNCSSLTFLEGLTGWKTGNVKDMHSMFWNCNGLTSLEGLENWNTRSVTKMSNMFWTCSSLISLEGLALWKTSNVVYMDSMFQNCSSLTSLKPLAGWDTGKVYEMGWMFRSCSGLISLEGLEEWNTSNVVYMDSTFQDCGSLISFEPLAGWNTSNVRSMNYMLNGCSKAKTADFSNWKIPFNKTYMLYNCSDLSQITISADFDFTNTYIPFPKKTDEFTGNWAYGDPWNHEETLTGAEFRTGTHKAGAWYWERKGESPLRQHYVTNSDNVFTPEYVGNSDDSTSLNQKPEEVFPDDGYWQQQDDNSWVYTFYVYEASVQWYVWEEPVPDGYISNATKDNPITIENGSIVSTVTNTLEPMPKEFGKLSIQKQLIDNSEASQLTNISFPFKITLTDQNNQQLPGVDVFGGTIFKDGVTYQSVSPSKTLEIIGIPAGYHYKVEELPDDKYIQEISNGAGVIQAEEQGIMTLANDAAGLVVATNTRIPEPERTHGNLTLRKNVTGNVDTDEAFNFTVSFGNLEPETTYTYGEQSFTSTYEGSADVEVSLKNGEEVVFENLPTNTQYRILEKAGEYTSSYTITDSNNKGLINQTEDANEVENEELVTATEILDEGEDVTVTFTNDILKTQNLSISKVVKDSSGQVISDTTRYEFSIEFTDAGANTEITSSLGVLRTDEEGNASASFFLKNGETLEFDGIPVGAKYRFTEIKNNAIASYTITDTLENDSVIKQNDANTTVKQELSTEFETVDNNEDSTVTFTNTYIKGALTVTKRSSDGDLLMGAEFRLINNDGTVYEPENIATDANGQITWNELPFDTYTLTETKAPAGATLMKEPIHIEITSDNPDVSIEVTDNSAIFLDAGGTGLITWMTISSATLALAIAYLLNEKRKKTV